MPVGICQLHLFALGEPSSILRLAGRIGIEKLIKLAGDN